MYKGKKIITIIPVYNEQSKAVIVASRVPEYVDTVLVVDDGSDDAGINELETTRAKIIRHERRMKIGAAIRTGIKYAIENKFDIISVVSGNNKDAPEEINFLLDKIIDCGFDYVQGSRYLETGRYGKMPLHRLLFTNSYSKFLSILMRKKITDATNGFRAYTTSIFETDEINLDQEWINETLEYYLSIKVLQSKKIKFCECPVTKLYPQNTTYKNYTKIKPFTGWLKRLLPLFYLTTGIKK